MDMNKAYAVWYGRKYLMRKRSDQFFLWLARHLPKRLIMWSYVDVVAVATTGKYSNTVVPELTAVDAFKRWSDEKGI
jgi:hypothetical protein